MVNKKVDRDIAALTQIVRTLERNLPKLTPAGKTWLRDRLNAVELRDAG